MVEQVDSSDANTTTVAAAQSNPNAVDFALASQTAVVPDLPPLDSARLTEASKPPELTALKPSGKI